MVVAVDDCLRVLEFVALKKPLAIEWMIEGSI